MEVVAFIWYWLIPSFMSVACRTDTDMWDNVEHIIAFRYFCCFTVATQNDDEPSTSILIVHPHQDVTLSYDLRPGNETPGWMTDHILYGAGSLANGILAGYSADVFTNNLIIKNIMMNDDRSGTWYQCVILRATHHHEVLEIGNITILYVAGE